MNWWQAMLVALLTLVVTKIIDRLIAISNDKRDFRRMRRNKVFDELEALKDQVGVFFELTANWKSRSKQAEYEAMFAAEDKLIGRMAKFPAVSSAARDVLHWCKIVAANEAGSGNDLIENKRELSEKFKAFMVACETELENIA